MKRNLLMLVATGMIFLGSIPSFASELVTVDNFVRAETDMTLGRYAKQGAFGKFLHIRQPTPIDKQDVIEIPDNNLATIMSDELRHVWDKTSPGMTNYKP